MIPLPPTLAPIALRWLAIALVGAALFGFGYLQGVRSEADRHVETIAQIATLGGKQTAATAITTRRQAGINQQTETDHAKRVAALRARLGPGRVRQPPTPADRGAVPGVPPAAAGPDAPATNDRPDPRKPAPEPDARACAGLESDAAVTTAQVLDLQAWAIKQRRAWLDWRASVGGDQ